MLDVGQTARVREEFATNSEYALILDLRTDRFDPASLDRNLI
jgi:hypothetical protein